ncbi:hypothetical protein [Sphingomonas sp. MM-1]|uniref:hypothetical protein n=1 Tax=Sphingomonas sp. MM-1 TaxID=745310 RepID=UPI000A681723|nr:hypothetical protein [Sphingomonas sp. MM-1]
MMSVRLTVLLDDDVEARFTAFCQERGFKKSTLAARLIREHLDRETKTPRLWSGVQN